MHPLVPDNVDLRDFAFMPLDARRLLTSETWVLGTGDERAAAMTLWLVSWHQVPAGSLPANDRMLDHLSQAKHWSRVKAHAMRGWVLADDGRYYHPVVAEKALEAWLEKLAQRLSSGAGNAKRWGVEFDPTAIHAEMEEARALLVALNPQSRALSKKRTSGIPTGSKGSPDGNPNGTRSGLPSRSQETETGTGTGTEREGAQAAPKPPSRRSRGCRLPADWQLTPALLAEAQRIAPTVDARREADRFRDYWLAASGANAVKADWDATWRNWVRRAGDGPPGPHANRPPSVDSPASSRP